jgi:hypothetical protein
MNYNSISRNQLILEKIFLVRDGLYRNPCVCVYLCTVYLSSVFRIVNETSTKASLAPGIDQLHSTSSWPGAQQVYRGWNKQPYNCSKQSVCSTSLDKNAAAHSILPGSKNIREEGALIFQFK